MLLLGGSSFEYSPKLFFLFHSAQGLCFSKCHTQKFTLHFPMVQSNPGRWGRVPSPALLLPPPALLRGAQGTSGCILPPHVLQQSGKCSPWELGRFGHVLSRPEPTHFAPSCHVSAVVVTFAVGQDPPAGERRCRELAQGLQWALLASQPQELLSSHLCQAGGSGAEERGCLYYTTAMRAGPLPSRSDCLTSCITPAIAHPPTNSCCSQGSS